MANRDAMINRAAELLGLKRLNQALPAEHNIRIGKAYDEIYAVLKKDSLAVWASDGDVPDEIVNPVAALMADNCLSSYGVSVDRYTRIKTECGPDGETAKARIRQSATPAYVSADSPTDF